MKTITLITVQVTFISSLCGQQRRSACGAVVRWVCLSSHRWRNSDRLLLYPYMRAFLAPLMLGEQVTNSRGVRTTPVAVRFNVSATRRETNLRVAISTFGCNSEGSSHIGSMQSSFNSHSASWRVLHRDEQSTSSRYFVFCCVIVSATAEAIESTISLPALAYQSDGFGSTSAFQLASRFRCS